MSNIINSNTTLIPSAAKEILAKESKNLFNMFRTSLTIHSQRLLDAYLQRTITNASESETVVFTKEECKGILGVEEITSRELIDCCKNLLQSLSITQNVVNEDIDGETKTLEIVITEITKSEPNKKVYTLETKSDDNKGANDFFLIFLLIKTVTFESDPQKGTYCISLTSSDIAKEFFFNAQSAELLKKNP